METANTNNELKVRVDNKQILSIALPITLAILVPQLNLLINNIFLGHLSKSALGNAGITGVFYLIFAVAGHGLNSAMQSVFSKYAGSGNPQLFKNILSQGIRVSLQLSIFFIVLTYWVAPIILKNVSTAEAYSDEISFLKIRIWGLPFLFLFQMGNAFLIASLNSRLLMIGFLIQSLFNILLDYLFIFGKAGFPKMGFNGAAYASVLSECIGMITVFAVIFYSGLKKKYALHSTFKFHPVINKEILKIAIPLVLQFIISITTWLVFFILIESKGANEKAISNTMRNVFGLAGIFVWAFAGTSNTMVANLIGQQLQHKVISVINKISLLSFCCSFIIVVLLNIFPDYFFTLFNQHEDFAKVGIPVIRTVSLGIIFMSFANIWLNGVTGTGKTRVNLLIEIIAITLYLIYTWYFMKLHYVSLAVAWSNEFIYWLTIFFISYYYMKSGRWKDKTIP